MKWSTVNDGLSNRECFKLCEVLSYQAQLNLFQVECDELHVDLRKAYIDVDRSTKINLNDVQIPIDSCESGS